MSNDELQAVAYRRGDNKTQYVLMRRIGDSWVPFKAVWAYEDGEAIRIGNKLVTEIRAKNQAYRRSVFTVMKFIATDLNGE